MSLGLGLGVGFASQNRIDLSFNPARLKYNAAKSLDVSAQDLSVSGLVLNGAQVLISGTVSDDIFRYDGAGSDDLSTAVVNAGVTDALSSNPTGLLYNDDGTRMFVFQSATAIEGYNCTAYTPSTNAYSAGYRLSVSAQGVTFGRGMCFTADGMGFLVVGDGPDAVLFYNLSSAYNPGSGSYNAAKSFDLSGVAGASIADVQLVKDDSVMQILDQSNRVLHYFTLSTPGDPSTAVYSAGKSLNISSTDLTPTAFAWDDTGTYLAIAGASEEKIHLFQNGYDFENNVYGVSFGDSLSVDVDQDSMATLLGAHYGHAEVTTMAQGGHALAASGGVNAYIDSDTDTITSEYTTRFANIPHPEQVRVIFSSIGTNGISLTGDSETFLGHYQILLDRFKADFPNLEHVVIYMFNRHTGLSDAVVQAASDTIVDLIDLDPMIKRGAELYDLATDDPQAIHPNAAGYTELESRLTNRVLGLLGDVSPVGNIGPEVTSGSFTDGSADVTVQITHDGGASLTGTETANFRIEVNGSPATINAMTLNADNIVFTLSAALSSGDSVQFWPKWGNGTWNETNIVRDNNGLPLISTKAVNLVEG